MRISGPVSVVLAGLLAGFASHLLAQPVADIRRGYVDGPYGQIHYARSEPSTPQPTTPLIMLHQTPNSLVEYWPLIAEMGADRVTIALDTPGYGGSDAPQTQPAIEDYARALAAALGGLGYGPDRPVDLLGNHTGAFIAASLATMAPEMVRRIALVGVYVVPAEELTEKRAGLRHPESYSEVLASWCARIPMVAQVYAEVGVPDAGLAIRIDSLRAPATKREYAHEAAFEFAARARAELPNVTQPTLLLAVDDHLGEATKRSAPYFSDGTLLDLPELRTGETVYDGLFYSQTERIADELRKFFDN